MQKESSLAARGGGEKGKLEEEVLQRGSKLCKEPEVRAGLPRSPDRREASPSGEQGVRRTVTCAEAVRLGRSPVTAGLISQVKKSEFFTKSNTVAQERLP